MSTHHTDYDEDYLVSIIDPSTGPAIIKAFIKYIKRSKVEFDTVVCRGTSGLLVAPQVSTALKKHLIISRKPSDGSHAIRSLEGFLHPEKYIIVDDLLSSGATVDSVLAHMNEYRNKAKCVGIFLYRSCRVDVTEFGGIPRFNQEINKRYTDTGKPITGPAGYSFGYGPQFDEPNHFINP